MLRASVFCWDVWVLHVSDKLALVSHIKVLTGALNCTLNKEKVDNVPSPFVFAHSSRSNMSWMSANDGLYLYLPGLAW